MDFLRELGIQETNSGAYCGEWLETSGELLESRSPATGELLATVKQATAEEYDQVVAAAEEAFLRWREVPAPIRGEIIRKMGNAIREKKDALGNYIDAIDWDEQDANDRLHAWILAWCYRKLTEEGMTDEDN